MTPRIAIPVPTSTDVPYNQRSWPSYARAVTLSGGEPVAIPLDLPVTTLRELIASCDGVLLPGSPADVDPALYGAERDPATAPADPAREAVGLPAAGRGREARKASPWDLLWGSIAECLARRFAGPGPDAAAGES